VSRHTRHTAQGPLGLGRPAARLAARAEQLSARFLHARLAMGRGDARARAQALEVASGAVRRRAVFHRVSRGALKRGALQTREFLTQFCV
jgi:hypothetical protein